MGMRQPAQQPVQALHRIITLPLPYFNLPRMLARPFAGSMGYHVVWAYASLAQAIFLVRTMKRVIFQEARHYSESAARVLCSVLVCWMV